MKKQILALGVAMLANTAAANTIELNYQYQEADSLKRVRGVASVEAPEIFIGDRYVSDVNMAKTLFAVELGNVLKSSLEEYAKIGQDIRPIPRPIPFPRPIGPIKPVPMPTPVQPIKPIDPIKPWPIPEPIVEDKYKEKRIAVAKALLAKIDGLQKKLRNDRVVRGEKRFHEVLDLGRSLAKNMKEAKPVFFGLEKMAVRSLASSSVGGGLNVTAGGAQDFAFVEKSIRDGRVPQPKALTMEGFLSEFDLALNMGECKELICVKPGLAVDAKKLYLQVGMNSKVTKATFKRKPLNVSVVLDVSGSMGATDNTEKQRIEWAKDALIQTLNELNENDIVSVVLFNSDMKVLVEPDFMTNRAALIEKVRTIKAGGSTNLEAGLRKGYEFVSDNVLDLEGYENRVILISDAGLNTGRTSEADLLRLVTDYSSEQIGLTAIGLGLNFNQEFIHGITASEGGNYIFVHSGKDMFRYFESFNFLVTPVAYNFMAKVDLGDLDLKLAKAYGVPAKEGEPVRELLNVQTLFFSEAGGALLLEFDRK